MRNATISRDTTKVTMVMVRGVEVALLPDAPKPATFAAVLGLAVGVNDVGW